MSLAMHESRFRPRAVHVSPQAPPAARAGVSGGAIEAAIETAPAAPPTLPVDRNLAGARGAQYRRLAASLHQLHPEGLSSVMVTSAMPGEGKSLTAVNLALTFSQSYHKEVLLIDADLRRPRLHEMFGFDGGDGLTQFLTAPNERMLPVRSVAPRLSLVTAGEATPDPMAKLTSARMKRAFAQASEAFDWVIVDTPAAAILPDAELIAAMVDGVLLVIRARSTPYESVKRAVDAIGRSRIVGVVLNQADADLLGSEIDKYERNYTKQAAGV